MSDIPQFAFKAEDLIKSGRTTRANLEEVRKWLLSRPEFPPMSDEQVVLFLIACNNILEATETTIECYFKHKANSPEIFRDRDVDSEELQQTQRVTWMAELPKRTKENYAVVIASLRDTYHYNFNLASQGKLAFDIIDHMLYSNPPSGLVIIINAKGIGFMHLTRLKIDIVKKITAYLQESMPTQLKQIHILNSTYIFDKILLILKPFMKSELFESIITHPVGTPMEEFFEKYVPASCMPRDFGGDLPTLQELSENFQEDCKKSKAFLKADERQIQRYKDNVERR